MKNHEHDKRAVFRNGKLKVILASLVLLIVVVGLNTALFTSFGLFNLNTNPTFEDLEITLDYLNIKLNGAQQGVHFLEGMVTAVIFAHPGTGFSVGFLKEIFDITGHIKAGTANIVTILDSLLDLSFWTIGGFAGFYAMIPLHGYLIKNNIKGVKDLTLFVSKKLRRK
jgi:hypothetical protein